MVECEEKNYNVEDLFVIKIKNGEAPIYYIVEIHESLKEFLFKSLENKKIRFKEILTGFIISREEVEEVESLINYYSPLELPKRVSKKEILEQYIIINDLKLHPKKEYKDNYDKRKEIVRKAELREKNRRRYK